MPLGREETRPAGVRRSGQNVGRNGGSAGAFDGLTNFDATRLSNALGWFSIALGLVSTLSPRSTARLIGVTDEPTTCTTLQLVGVRELISGIGILSNPEAPGWVWSRVAGDVMDLALLATAFSSDRADPNRLTATTAAVAGITFIDLLCAERLSERGSPKSRADAAAPAAAALSDTGSRIVSKVSEWTGNRPIHVVSAITVKAPPEQVYRFWRNVENLPRMMEYLESVQPLDDRRSRWVAQGPLGSRLEWESEITEDVPGERIAWRTRPGAAMDSRGVVTFEQAPGNRGTIVKVEFDYRPPGGRIGAAFAKLLGRAPDQEAEEDLRRLKQIIEIGDVLESDTTVKGMGAAQPPADVPERVRKRASQDEPAVA